MGIKNLIKNYKELGHKKFFENWKQGIEAITPLAQTNSQITFTWITLIGIALGFAISIYAVKNMWWIAIILAGAFGNTYVGLVALKQKKKLLEQFEEVKV